MEAAFLKWCPPHDAYQWLRGHSLPENGERSSRFGEVNRETQLLEFVLLRRRDLLIDLGLARYGHSGLIIKSVYMRGGSSIRCAAWSNQAQGRLFGAKYLWCDEADLRYLALAAPQKQLEAFAANPVTPDDLLMDLIKKRNVFSEISEDRYVAALLALADNPRITNPEGQYWYMDGYDYRDYKIFDEIWSLALSIPATQHWAGVLERVLRQCRQPVGFAKEKADEIIARWRIDLTPREGERYSSCRSFHLRSRLGDLKEANTELKESDDLALRLSFYRRFDPKNFDDWPSWVELDGEEFVDAAKDNENLWRKEKLRDSLQKVCRSVHNPQRHPPNFVYYGYYISEEKMRNKFPSWFLTNEHLENDLDIRILRKIDATISESMAILRELVSPSRFSSVPFWVWLIVGMLAADFLRHYGKG